MFEGLSIPGFGHTSQTACVEVHIAGDGSIRYHLLILAKNRTKLQITSSAHNLFSMEELLKQIKKGTPVILLLTGKGVILRKVSQAAEPEKIKLLHTIFPDARSADFIMDRITSTGNDSFIAVTRKTLIEKVIKPFLKEKIPLLDLFVGPLVLSDILSLFDSQENRIQASDYQAEIKDSLIVDFRNKDCHLSSQISCGGIQIDSCLLLCFAAGFRHLVIERG